MIKLEQLYWGHDGGRYRLLGASSQAPADEVARFRDRLGTPDGLSEIKPFLLSVPVGDRLIMMCGRQGRRDNIGRKTLFFHALIGNRTECTQHRVNAYSLWEAGLFKAEYVDGTSVEPIWAQDLPEMHAPGAETPPWDGQKLAIRSAEPENELVCRMLGTRINDVPWAGFTWNPLDDFPLYAISRYAAMPKDRPCHDLKKTADARPEPAPLKPSTPDLVNGEKMKRGSNFSVILLSILLIVSLGFNAWLAWQCHIGKTRQQPPPTPKVKFDWDKKVEKTHDIRRIWKDNGKEDSGSSPEDFKFLSELKAIVEGQKDEN